MQPIVSRRPARSFGAVLLVASLAVAASCGGDSDDATSTTESTSAPEAVSTTDVPDGGDTTSPPASTSPPDTTAAPVPTDAPATTTAPTTAAPATTAPTGRDFSMVHAAVDEFVADNGLTGAGLVVVHRDEGVVNEYYAGEFDAERVSLVASSSKMVTAGVLMRLHDQGLIDIDAPVADYVEWGSGNPDITIAQLVSNSSGLVGLGPDPTYAPYICQFLPDREIEECAAEVFTTTDDDADIIAPDTEYRYGGVQWQIAGAVAEAVSGKTWQELIEETYIEPCGVESMGYNNHWFSAGGFDYPEGFDPADLAPTENPHMEGGLYIDPLDYATLLMMHLNEGECPNGQVLTAESTARMHEDRVASYGDAGGADTGYGMGWWVDRETGIISDGGAYGSYPWLDVEAGYGAYWVIENGSAQGDRDGLLELVAEAVGV